MAKLNKIHKLTVAEEARARLQLVVDAETGNRASAMDDVKFAAGDQWPIEIKMQRQLDRRPCLTINKTDTFCRSVVNNMRQQRPRMRVHPVGDGADVPVAEVLQGLLLHIEVTSNADAAYDTAADSQVRMGWGYWRIRAKYQDETSFTQDLHIERIRNTFSVFFDPGSVAPDGSDAEWVILVAPIKQTEFEIKYPGKKISDFKGLGDDLMGYAKNDEVMLAEYFRIEHTAEKLYQMSNGKSAFLADMEPLEVLHAKGIEVVDSRDSMRRVVKWSLLSGLEELEKRDCAGRYLPVIPVYGAEVVEGGKCIRYGMVRNLKDPQKMYNFWRTQETEFVALAPKAPWLMAEGQDEGREEEWNNANVRNYSSLKYKIVHDENGTPMPPPQRLSPQQVPAASVNAAMAASEDLKAVAGMFDPALGAGGNETSGQMVSKRQQQSDLSNFHFYDNLTRSIRWTGIVLLDLIPYYYDTKRTIRIIGEDGNPEATKINEQAADKILNDLTVGQYDIVMDTGPGYDSKREQASDMMINIMKTVPEVGKIAGDLIVRQMDFPGANALADRLAMSNPMAQIDKEMPDNLDPKVKQMLSQAMGQVKHLQGQLDELNKEKMASVFGVQEREQAITQREMLVQREETQRLHLREIGEHERAEMRGKFELENTDRRNETSLHETLIDATTNLQIDRKKAMQRGAPNNNTSIKD